MATKECESRKYCCFYVSDFHLEMILLPYIKNNIDKTKFSIFTEENLSESIKILLDRTNLNTYEKRKILELDWKNKKIENINYDDLNDNTIIINGNKDYISKINNKIKNINIEKINIIDCYNINDKNLIDTKVKEKYDGVLNSKGT